jgi:transcription elongation factor GreA
MTDTQQIKKIPFTREAYEKLQSDFDRLTAERAEVMVRLQTAREMGDLSENGAYHYAKFELGSINRQLARLKHLLENGEVIEKKAESNSVEFGCSVTLQNEAGKEITYTIVSLHESDLLQRKLSTESPLGQALLGKKVGEKVTVQTPTGEVVYTVKKIT